MSKKIRVGIVFGGRSGEHEVSLVSAAAVIKAINKSKFEVIPIGITKQGNWITASNPLKLLKSGLLKNVDSDGIITPDATKKSLIKISSKITKLPKKIHNKIDVIFPVLHGTYGEDGAIQGLLELANLPYVGANVLASAIGMDKIIQKQIFQQVGLPVVRYVHFLSKHFKKNNRQIITNINKLKYPVFVKPANSGSSVGITKVYNAPDLPSAIKYAAEFDRKIIVEKAVMQSREIEIAVLGNDSPKISVPGEIITSNDFYDYDAKYVDGKSRVVIPAKINATLARKIKAMAIFAFQAIDCSGMARADFLLSKNNKIYISELNTIPGFTSISMYPKLWAASGLSYEKLIEKLILLALERHKEKSKLPTSYQPKQKWYS